MKNIAIIGLMGSGKSTIGALLAKKIRLNFVDIDEEIEKRTNTTISEIFKKKGEPFFRKLETTTIEEFATKSNQIISTGGGAVQNEQNLKILQQNSTLIYLKTSLNVIFERIKNETQRPLLQNSDPLGTLQELLEKRQKNYEKADIIVDTDNKTTDEIVNEIIKNVKS
jgi:shikimate kinase